MPGGQPIAGDTHHNNTTSPLHVRNGGSKETLKDCLRERERARQRQRQRQRERERERAREREGDKKP